MPRFETNGPIVPDKLVQDLEDDHVVVFCGAGISMGAGLPSFMGLVSHCYEELGEQLPPSKSTEWLWPDRMLGALESRFGPDAVREKTAERLNVAPSDLTMHQAIINLAKLRHGNGLRLVTTNFDTLFEQAHTGMLLGHDYHSGPILPIPLNDQITSWKSIVYLHGRLEPTTAGNRHLVLTSADFGRAYLTEAWAARFVARLFSEFTVLFIGYSLNDPVLRYMTDAFAAEDAMSRAGRMRGPAYIFVPHTKTAPDPRPWRNRLLTPIFYNQARNHIRLKNTLIKWADARKDYLSNTKVMINRIAPLRPSGLDPSATDNLLWAVVGRPGDDGHGARVFADLDPPAPIDWLSEFERRDTELRQQYEKDILATQKAERPPPISPLYHIEPLFPPRMNGVWGPLSDTADHLTRWLIKHLETAEFVEWVVGKLSAERRPHPMLRMAIRRRLGEAPPLASGFNTFWRIVSSEGEWTTNHLFRQAGFGLRNTFAAHRDEVWAIQEFGAALRPWLTFEKSFAGAFRADITLRRGLMVSDIARAVVHLADEDHLKGLIDVIQTTPDPDRYWAERLDLTTGLLRQVLDLYSLVGEADRNSDPSSLQRPSVVPHPQNNFHAKWTVLFDLIWRGWAHIDTNDSVLSRQIVEAWRRVPFQSFRRLALAATAHSPHFSSTEKMEALLND